jgi:glycosyltransferase involved in cell wall biosynthesis
MENIVVRGPCSQSGYGRQLIGLLKVITEAGHEPRFLQLNVHQGQHRKGFSDSTLKYLDSISINPDDACIKDSTLIDVGSLIYALGVPLPECKRSILYTVTETTGIHKEYVYMLNNKYSEIWTASNFNKVGFIGSGVTNTVKLLPEYVDLEHFNPNVKPMKLKNKRGFNFIVNVDMSYRKGLHLLLPAFIEVFDKDDDVSLILKVSNGNFGRENAHLVIDPLNEILYKLRVKDTSHAPILLFIDLLTDDLMPSFYRMGDCHVSTNLGEGFCLPIAESMGCGLPQLISRCGAPLDYMNRKSGHYIDLDESKPTQPVKDPSLLQRDPRYKGCEIFNIDINSLKTNLQYCYVNQAELKEKGVEARKRVEQKLGLDKLATTFNDIYETGAEEITL